MRRSLAVPLGEADEEGQPGVDAGEGRTVLYQESKDTAALRVLRIQLNSPGYSRACQCSDAGVGFLRVTLSSFRNLSLCSRALTHSLDADAPSLSDSK